MLRPKCILELELNVYKWDNVQQSIGDWCSGSTPRIGKVYLVKDKDLRIYRDAGIYRNVHSFDLLHWKIPQQPQPAQRTWKPYNIKTSQTSAHMNGEPRNIRASSKSEKRTLHLYNIKASQKSAKKMLVSMQMSANRPWYLCRYHHHDITDVSIDSLKLRLNTRHTRYN